MKYIIAPLLLIYTLIQLSVFMSSADNSAPYWLNEKWWKYCWPSDKDPWTWDDLRNYWNWKISGGCVIAPKTAAKDTWNSGNSNSATSDAPYWYNQKWWKYCGASNKAPWTWDDLRNYWDWSISGGCVAPGWNGTETPRAEVTELAISSMNAIEITQNSAKIRFVVSDYAKWVVMYGTTSDFWNSTNPERSFNYKDHTQPINNLNSDTRYYYRVVAQNKNWKYAARSGQFTTKKNVSSWNSWETNQAPYGRNDKWWALCGSSDKSDGTWDNLANYGDWSVSWWCIVENNAWNNNQSWWWNGSWDGNGSDIIEDLNTQFDSSTPTWKNWYTLKFSDEFNWNSLDKSKWTTRFLWWPNITINSEEQYYVDILWEDAWKRNPFSFENGKLIISADIIPSNERSQYNGKKYTSGIITTYDSHQYSYGYTEARIKIPRGKGLWPAFWQLNQLYRSYLIEPEIDIMENLWDNTRKVYQTYHHYNNSKPWRPQEHYESHKQDHDYASDYHVYAVERGPGFLQFYIDDQPTNRIEWQYNISDENMYILLNLAVGWGWPWSPDNSTQFPAKYYIDWVRMYSQ